MQQNSVMSGSTIFPIQKNRYYYFSFKYTDGSDVVRLIIGSIAAVFNGIAYSGQLVLAGNLINKFIEFRKEELVNTGKGKTIDLFEDVKYFAEIYCYAAIASWIFGYLQISMWSISAIRQTYRIKIMFFKSTMKQNIGWFDLNEGGKFATMFE